MTPRKPSEAVERMAKKLFRADHPNYAPHCPYRRPLELSDLWPSEQEPYFRRAAYAVDAGEGRD